MQRIRKGIQPLIVVTVVLSTVFGHSPSCIQAGEQWLTLVLGQSPMVPMRRYSQDPRPGCVVIRGKARSDGLNMLRKLAETFPGKERLDVNFDDHASFGRFCDRDDPFHVVIQEGRLTDHDRKCRQWRFPAGKPQPEAFPLGQRRVVLVVHKANPIKSMTFAGIAKALSEESQGAAWRDVGGAGGTLLAYGPAEDAWARTLVRIRCMTRWEDAEPGVRRMVRPALREDLVACADAAEVIAKVRGDRSGLGFFAWDETLTETDLRGVRIVPVAKEEASPPVAPPLTAIVDESYPLAEPIVLYLHPDAPPLARQFCEFVTGSAGVQTAKQLGLSTNHDLQQAQGKQRLAEVKKGKGATITVADLAGQQELLEALSLKYVEAKAAVRPKFPKCSSRETLLQSFHAGLVDLLLTDQPLPSQPSPPTPNPKSQIPNPKSLPLGRRAVAIIVHPDNPLKSLPVDQVRDILSGQIKKWPYLDGPSATIRLYGLPAQDPTTQLLRERLAEAALAETLRASGLPADTTTLGSVARASARQVPLQYTAKADSAKVMAAVACEPGALGFVDRSQLAPNEKSVRLVPVTHSVKAEVAGDEEPLGRTLWLHVGPNASQEAQDFAAFLTPSRTAETLAQHGLLPPSMPRDLAHLSETSQPSQLTVQLGQFAEEEPAAAPTGDEPIPLRLDDPSPRPIVRTTRRRPTVIQTAAAEVSDSPRPEDLFPVPHEESTAQPSQPGPTPRPTKPAPEPPQPSETTLGLPAIVATLVLALALGWLLAPHRKKRSHLK